MKHKTIKPLPVLKSSGYDPKPGIIETFKVKNYFIVTDIAITGDAPKDFIRFYEYGYGYKKNTKNWKLYLAKLGHKHYPVESITEFLLSRIGEYFGFKMAETRLAFLGGQIRFLSKYFLSNPRIQVLEHGAEIYAGYLNDKEFVEKVEEIDKARELFTVQFTNEVINHFELMNKLYEHGFLENIQILKEIFYDEKFIHNVHKRIDADFEGLLSHERINLINSCLLYRYKKLRKILNFAL